MTLNVKGLTPDVYARSGERLPALLRGNPLSNGGLYTQRSDYTEGFLYLACIEGTTICKIGLSRNPKKRLKELRFEVKKDLILLSACWVESMKDAEQELLNRFQHKKIAGEWFNLDSLDIDFIIKSWAEGVL